MRYIKNWAVATFILCFLVIIAGGVVRTTQSGMGCPDWPKCFGKWIPPTHVSELPPDFEKYLRKQDIDHTFNAYHTWIEYINRLLGVLLGLFAVVQVLLLLFSRRENKTTFRLAAAFLVVVIITGLFGAIVVKFNLAHLSVSVHLLFAVLLVQVQLALLLSLRSKLFYMPVLPHIKKAVLFFLLVLVIQSVLGTMVRMYVDDVSKTLQYQQRSTWLAAMPAIFIVHRSFSWIVLLLATLMAWYCRNTLPVKNKAVLLLAIVSCNVLVGIVLFYAAMPAAAQPIHLLLAVIAITQTVYMLLTTKSATQQLYKA
jgi:heme a synthase